MRPLLNFCLAQVVFDNVEREACPCHPAPTVTNSWPVCLICTPPPASLTSHLFIRKHFHLHLWIISSPFKLHHKITCTPRSLRRFLHIIPFSDIRSLEGCFFVVETHALMSSMKWSDCVAHLGSLDSGAGGSDGNHWVGLFLVYFSPWQPAMLHS